MISPMNGVVSHSKLTERTKLIYGYEITIKKDLYELNKSSSSTLVSFFVKQDVPKKVTVFILCKCYEVGNLRTFCLGAHCFSQHRVLIAKHNVRFIIYFHSSVFYFYKCREPTQTLKVCGLSSRLCEVSFCSGSLVWTGWVRSSFVSVPMVYDIPLGQWYTR